MENQNTFYLTKLRALAIAMVLVLHVGGPVRDQLEYMATLNWLVGAFFDALARNAVPLFVMISGALLLDKEESIGTFYRKRFSRLLVPFFVWGLFYAIYDMHEVEHVFKPLQAFLNVLQGHSYYHLWYLYMLIGLYLSTPFVRILMKHIQKKQLEILLLLWLVFRIILPHLYAESALWLNFPFQFRFSYSGVDVYLGYYILGFYLHRYGVPKLRFSTYILLYFLVSLALVTCSYALYLKSKAYNPLCILNESPFVLMQAFLLFNAFKLKNTMGASPWAKAVTQISALSFGIYLVHPIIIDLLDKGYLGFELDARQMDTILSMPITFVVVFVASFLFCYLVSKIPIVNRIIG